MEEKKKSFIIYINTYIFIKKEYFKMHDIFYNIFIKKEFFCLHLQIYVGFI